MFTTPPSAPKVLTVDDSEIVQKSIQKALKDRGVEVLVADNAVDALNLIYNESIAVVLLDVSMPGVDGLELCRTIRSIPEFQSLPIVMVTARDSPFDKVQGQLAGATQYLTKPFDAETLQTIVQGFIDRLKSR
ncbi:response regulator [Roseofilum sp. BLCC_M154]|uniref:Response regulator n=1 Tax=Roseofilum acuticapitatum BLCC-M154 TaxID=3022444 RepID=A0ABT7AVJ1_9CYAN|nr:response regulator [Roseofilum acuticapitatum BLCC-M154]